MDLKEAIYTRRAVRSYTNETVGDDTARALIDAAIQAPSAVNQQPCTFCVVRDRSLLARISREAKAYMVKSTPIGLMSHHFNEILNDANFNIFYHARSSRLAPQTAFDFISTAFRRPAISMCGAQ